MRNRSSCCSTPVHLSSKPARFRRLLEIPEVEVTLEEEAFRIVLEVLIDNAQTHRETGHPGTLAVRMQIDPLTPTSPQRWLTLTVDDDGSGSVSLQDFLCAAKMLT